MKSIPLLLAVILGFAACRFGTTAGAAELPAATEFDLQGFVDRELAAGNKHIVVPPGRYRVKPEDGRHLSLHGLQNVEITAKNVEMICTQTTQALAISNCSNVTLRGLTIDYDPLPFTQGRITGFAENKRVHEVELFKGYPPAASAMNFKYEIFRPDTRTLRCEDRYLEKVEVVDPSHLRMFRASGRESDEEQVGDLIVIGSQYAPDGSAPHGVVCADNVNVKLEDITLFASNCFGFLEHNCDASTYLRCRIGRRVDDPFPRADPRLRSLDADAYHSTCAIRGPAYLGCTAAFMGDDCVNIHGDYHMIMSAEGKTLRVLAKQGMNIRPGDPVELVSHEGDRLPDAQAVSVESVGGISDAERAFLLDQPMDRGTRTAKGGLNKAYAVTLDRPVGLPMGSLICSSNRIGNGFAVKDCSFGSNRSRGILIKASNGEISGNTVSGSRMAAILVTPEYWWLEAGSSSNLKITGNTITDCGDISIDVCAQAGSGRTAPAGVHRNIEITGNTIKNSPMPGILVTSTVDARISSNTFNLNPTTRLPEVMKQAGMTTLQPVVLIQCRDSSQSDSPSMKFNALFLLPLVTFLAANAFAADLQPNGLFRDHMVLQRECAVPVWGTATPGDMVSVAFGGQVQKATADAQGAWRVSLDRMSASAEPRQMIITAGTGKAVIEDVVVGEVWLCSGQSNMTLAVTETLNAAQEIAAARYPGIRLYTVPRNGSLEPQAGVNGQWEPCSPETVRGFSATAYYYGRELYRKLNVPIGLIHASYGATPAEAWTSLPALNEVPALKEMATRQVTEMRAAPALMESFPERLQAWTEKYGCVDQGNKGFAEGWAAPECDTSDWKKVTVGFNYDSVTDAKSGGGIFWLRKQVDLPASAAGKGFYLGLGWLAAQTHVIYFNGVEVGRMGSERPDYFTGGRGAYIPGNLVKEGRNLIAIRFRTFTKDAGFYVPGRDMNLPVADPAGVNNDWLLKPEVIFPGLPATAESLPTPPSARIQYTSGALFNYMIQPLIPFAIHGAIWYQGESNTDSVRDYRQLLSTLIRDWRARWGEGDFPFYIVQLANYYAVAKSPLSATEKSGGDNVARVREAQLQVSEYVPNTALAVAIDVGEENIHPKNKQAVGKRLALDAFANAFGEKIESSGPVYDGMTIGDHAVSLRFSHVGTGLLAKGANLRQIAIAGANRKFVWADARIVAPSTIVVSSPQVPDPVAVRYAWASNPEGCNLYNSDDLPASPFRTDSWDAVRPEPDVSFTDPDIRYIGRWDRSGGALAHSYWSCAYLRVGFTGTTIKVKLASGAGMFASLDGQPYREFSGGGMVDLTPEPLAAGTHTLLLAADGQNNELQVEGFALAPGAVSQAVPERPLVEFIGDSITACPGKDAPSFTNYAWLTGEALGYDHTQIAFSGVALVTGYGFFKDKTGFDQWYFQRANCNHPKDIPWWFSYHPQMVVINLGTNDVKDGKRPTTDEYAASYANFISAVRARYPAAVIVAMRPFGGALADGVKSAVAEVNAAGDKNVHYVDTTGWLENSDYSDGIHPTRDGHAKVALRLKPALADLFPR